MGCESSYLCLLRQTEELLHWCGCNDLAVGGRDFRPGARHIGGALEAADVRRPDYADLRGALTKDRERAGGAERSERQDARCAVEEERIVSIAAMIQYGRAGGFIEFPIEPEVRLRHA